LLAGYSGIVQCDGYAVYEQRADPTRDGGAVTLAFCWSHWRREFFDIDKGGPAPIADEALERIAALYAIESRIRGRSAEERRAVRQAETVGGEAQGLARDQADRRLGEDKAGDRDARRTLSSGDSLD
jgi:hypothetical protein